MPIHSPGAAGRRMRGSSSLPFASAGVCLKAISYMMGGHRWLAGARLTLADLSASPVIAYFVLVAEERDLLAERHNLAAR